MKVIDLSFLVVVSICGAALCLADTDTLNPAHPPSNK